MCTIVSFSVIISIIIIINKVLIKVTLNIVIAGALYIVICGWNAVKVQGWQLTNVRLWHLNKDYYLTYLLLLKIDFLDYTFVADSVGSSLTTFT